MSIPAQKIIKIGMIILGTLAVGVLFFIIDNEPITIQSLESKNPTGGPVYNKIKFFPGFDKDIWMMNQSHQSLGAESQQWDRLAIIVDKTGKQKTAKFLQLPPGELKWSEGLLKQNIDFKISCYMCHSNGPRAIRPDKVSLGLDLKTQAKIFFGNLRIKTYGQILENKEQATLDQSLKIPFRHRMAIDNEELNIKSCTKCHSDGGFLKRGFLRRQNMMTIKFMIDNEIMPPKGFSLNSEDKNQIKNFILGL